MPARRQRLLSNGGPWAGFLGWHRAGPALVAAAHPAYAVKAAHATILVAAVIVITLLVPLLTAWTAKATDARPEGASAITTAPPE